MSLYNMVAGSHPLAGWILHHLKLSPSTVDRLRDACIFKDDNEGFILRVLTRTGGGNRESHRESNERLANHEFFIRENDDPYDSTYALFYFKMPQTMLDELKEHDVGEAQLERMADNASLKDKFDAALEALGAKT